MKKFILVGALGLALATQAQAGWDGDAAVGGALGGATGALIGSAVGGRDAAIIGGLLGGATGVAIATRDNGYRRVETVQYRPVPPAYYRPVPVQRIYYTPPRYYGYEERVVYSRPEPRKGHGWGHEWRHQHRHDNW